MKSPLWVIAPEHEQVIRRPPGARSVIATLLSARYLGCSQDRIKDAELAIQTIAPGFARVHNL